MDGPDIAMVGLGAIGQQLLEHLRSEGCARLVALLVKPEHAAAARAAVGPDVALLTDPAGFLNFSPEIVVEVGGHGALRQVGPTVVGSGRALFTVSAGALADPGFREAMQDAARLGGGSCVICCGATAGIDGLRALQEGGPFSVTYTSTKPPQAWRGTKAELLVNLDDVHEARCFFEGTADRAALEYPKNANIAATVALAGAGFAGTTVRLVVDPDAVGNRGRIEARSPVGTLDVSTGGPASSNPKTSAVTALSIAAAIRDRRAALAFR